MTTLEDPYYGDIRLCERDVVRGSLTNKLLRLFCKNEKAKNKNKRCSLKE